MYVSSGLSPWHWLIHQGRLILLLSSRYVEAKITPMVRATILQLSPVSNLNLLKHSRNSRGASDLGSYLTSVEMNVCRNHKPRNELWLLPLNTP